MSPTSSTVTISLIGVSYTSKNTSYFMMWYHLAGFIWTLFTLTGMSELIIAGAVAEWYWTMDKSKKLPPHTVTTSAWRAFRYHLGSVILGSLLITIVELIRFFLYNMQKQVAKSPNPWLKYVVACAQCCMKCIEVLLKWINRHAYGNLIFLAFLTLRYSIYCHYRQSLFCSRWSSHSLVVAKCCQNSSSWICC